MSDLEAGCWVVYSYDLGPAIVEAVFPDELSALRFAGGRRGMHVAFLVWGDEATRL